MIRDKLAAAAALRETVHRFDPALPNRMEGFLTFDERGTVHGLRGAGEVDSYAATMLPPDWKLIGVVTHAGGRGLLRFEFLDPTFDGSTGAEWSAKRFARAEVPMQGRFELLESVTGPCVVLISNMGPDTISPTLWFEVIRPAMVRP